MGKLEATGDEMADGVVTGTFAATGQSSAICFGPDGNGGNVSIFGTFSATLALQRSFDGGTTWINVTDAYGTALPYTAPATFRVDEPERGVIYRLNCSAYTSGTVSYRLSH